MHLCGYYQNFGVLMIHDASIAILLAHHRHEWHRHFAQYENIVADEATLARAAYHYCLGVAKVCLQNIGGIGP